MISSQLLNRQDGEDEYHVPARPMGEGVDPRKAGGVRRSGCCCRELHYAREDRMMLGYQCANSRMTIAVAADHWLETDGRGRDDPARATRTSTKMVFRVEATRGQHRPAGQDGRLPHLARRARSASCPTGATAPWTGPRRHDVAHYHAEQRAWFDRVLGRQPTSRSSSDAERDARPAGDPLQPVHAWPRPAPAPTSRACPPRASPGSGYEGHYFWDTEVYVAPVPHLHAARRRPQPPALPHAGCCRRPGDRAREMAQSGALFPWRTINGEEASAYYAAGTAQVHIDADIAYALVQVRRRHRRRRLPGPRRASTSSSRPPGCGPTSGFWRSNGERRPSTSTGSPARTSTRPSSTTTCSPT